MKILTIANGLVNWSELPHKNCRVKSKKEKTAEIGKSSELGLHGLKDWGNCLNLDYTDLGITGFEKKCLNL